MPVQALDSRCDGEASGKSSGTELGCAATRSEDSTNGDIFDEVGVDLGARDQSLESTSEEVSGLGVLEATLATLGEWSAKSACDDDLCNILSATDPLCRMNSHRVRILQLLNHVLITNPQQ